MGKLAVLVEAFATDLRYGVRMLYRNGASNVPAIAILAISLGAVGTLFNQTSQLFLNPLPYPHSQRLVMFFAMTDSDGSLSGGGGVFRNPIVRTALPERWQQVTRSFEHVAWYAEQAVTVNGAGDPVRRLTGLVSSDFFECLSVRPMLGRTFRRADMVPGQDAAVVLSNSFWRREFGADPSAIGRHLIVDDAEYTVIGILADRFEPILPDFEAPAVWIPISRSYTDKRPWASVRTFARLKNGVSISAAQSEMDAVTAQLRSEGRTFQLRGVRLTRLDGEIAQDAKPGLLLLLAAACGLLALTCSNLTALMLARTRARKKEMGIRIAIGATRGRLIMQILTETILIAGVSSGLGLLLSKWIGRAVTVFYPFFGASAGQFHPGGALPGFFFLAAPAVGLLFGLLPAWHATVGDITQTLKETGPLPDFGTRMVGSGSALIVVEIAITYHLLAGAGLFLQTLQKMEAIDPGFRTEGLTTMTIPLSRVRYPTAKQQALVADQLLERIRAVPGVHSASVANSLPLIPGQLQQGLIRREDQSADELSPIFVHAVSADYFRTMGIRVLAGRGFTGSDEKRLSSVVLNEAAARHYWPRGQAAGKRLILGSEPVTVVGVVRDVGHLALGSSGEMELYVPFSLLPAETISMAIQTSLATTATADAARAALKSIDPNQLIDNVAAMSDVCDSATSRPRATLFLVGAFSVLGAALSILGLYGVTMSDVLRRSHEMGVRLALGASRWNLLQLILFKAGALAGIGLAIGVSGSLVLLPAIRSSLYGVGPLDARTLFLAGVLLSVSCLAGAYVPASRVLAVNPADTLRKT
jgi:predicted permease